MKSKGTIAILTGGGDVPGLNPAIRAITIRALREGYRVLGIRGGWAGLVDMLPDIEVENSDQVIDLSEDLVNRVGRTGGTFLHTSRTKPSALPRHLVPDHLADTYAEETNDLTPAVLKNLEYLEIDYLIPIGGDDTLGYAQRLHEWVYFDFSRRSVIPDAARRSLDWDLAFQRHRILTNGGATNPAGQGGVLDLGPQPLDSAFEVPLTGYVTDERPGDASRNRVLEDWYDYSWTSHILTPSDRTYAIRTADGRYAALRFVAYYCPGARPGCVTFLYAYRGDGGRRFPPE